MENEFPPNSHVRKEVRAEKPRPERVPEKKEVQQITRNKVIRRKKPLYKKFFEAFRPEDNVGFVEYTLLEVIVPGIKDAFGDAAHGTIDNLFGSHSPRSRRRSSRDRGGYTSYSRMASSRPRSRRDDDDDERRRPAKRGPSDHHEIVVATRVEGEEIIDNLFELISRYDMATMRDLLSMSGEPHNFTDEDWGWFDLRGARIHRVREGYLIDLPRPVPLD